MEKCHNSVIKRTTDTFQTHLCSNCETFSGNIFIENVSKICQIAFYDTFLTHLYSNCETFQETFALKMY